MPRKKAEAELAAVPEEKKPAAKKPAAKKTAAKKTAEADAAKKPARKTTVRKKTVKEPDIQVEIYEEQAAPMKVAFIGSECYPFVKTGGLGDVMYALPRALVKQNVEVRVMLPNYKCIPQKWKDQMEFKGSFMMDLCEDGRQFYVGLLEYAADGVIYDFIDNEEFFTAGKPYINLIDDIPRFCYFSKATLAVPTTGRRRWCPFICARSSPARP